MLKEHPYLSETQNKYKHRPKCVNVIVHMPKKRYEDMHQMLTVTYTIVLFEALTFVITNVINYA